MEHVQHMSVSGFVQLCGDQMNMQRVGCLCTLFLALCAGASMGGDLRT